MNYKLIYDNLIKRGKSRRVKNPTWGAWHKHHITPKHMGGDNSASNLTKLQVKEHKLAHRLLYVLYRKQEDYVAYKCLGNNFSNMWENEAYRAYMLPKVVHNLSKVDRVLAGKNAGVAALKTIHKTLLNPDVRSKAQQACREWCKENPEVQASKARFMHTEEAVAKMSRSRSKYIIIDPQGNEYLSTREAATATNNKVKNVTNWVIRSHYGWSRKLKVLESGIA